MTIEASLAITFFLVFFLSVVSLFLVMDLQLGIQRILEQLGDETVKAISLELDAGEAEQGQTKEETNGGDTGEGAGVISGMEGIRGVIREGLEQEALRQRFMVLLRQNLDTGGGNHPGMGLLAEEAGRISFVKSEIDLETGQILLAVTYPVQLPVGIVNVGEFTITQYSYRYGWIGDEPHTSKEKEPEGQIVYITEDSQVYHLSDNCTYLRLSVHPVPMSEIWELRNEDGRVYTACERCRPESAAEVVYVTDHGDRYHGDMGCSSLKRTVQAISITEIGERRLCSRCAKISREG